MKTPKWFKKAIIYQILIDRFAGYKSNNWNKNDFIGGNIKGIIKKLPYIKKLGVNTIWISPFYKTSAYHGYHITDFFKVEPNFGNLTHVKELIKKTHEKGMRIIADFVPNHCSWKHPYFKDAQKNKNSKYKNWFYFKKWPNKYLCFLSFKELPKINLDYPPAREHIIKSAKYWLSLGFDGFRLDHVIGPKHKFWREFRKKIKKDFPEAVLIGEAWIEGIKLSELKTINIKNKFLRFFIKINYNKLFKEYIKELDGVLDFGFQKIIKKHITKKGSIEQEKLNKKLKKHFKKFPKDYFLPTFLDNHDMNRFLFECNNNKEKLKKAARIQFSINQPKIVYYGTETGMTQERDIKKIKENGDLQARKPMNWNKIDNNLLSFYKRLIKNKNTI